MKNIIKLSAMGIVLTISGLSVTGCHYEESYVVHEVPWYEQERAKRYWTKRRMRDAEPMPMPRPPRHHPRPRPIEPRNPVRPLPVPNPPNSIGVKLSMEIN